MTDLFFPSEDHRRSLCDKVKDGGLKALDDIEARQFHAYRYAWRRVRLGDREQKYGCDPAGDWFDGYYVNKAILFYTADKGLPQAQAQRDPSPEDIAHVSSVCAKIYANLAAWGDRNRAAFERAPTDPAVLAALQAGLGIKAKESDSGEKAA